MDQSKPLKVRLTFSVILVGISLLFAAVVTDHWAVLSPSLEENTTTCEAAHFGLWRLCTKRIFLHEPGSKEKSCHHTPMGHQGCSNVHYVIFGGFFPLAEYSISAAAIAIFSVGFAIMGTICVLLSFRKKRDYLLKPASMFYTFAGLCIIISVEVMRQSVKRMIDSKDTAWIEYSYSWSFACACAAFVLLFVCGIALLLIALPRFPQNPWETCMDAEPDH
uniref:Voltage-dependent calcium channel gamma-1 subunit n=1 Tax=Serinus canaria TaxID=9135 RepID=A0A8C9NKL4_SERCA